MVTFRVTFSNHPKLLMIGQRANLEKGGNILKISQLKCCRVLPVCDIQSLIVRVQPSTRVRVRPKALPGPARLKGAAAIVLSWAIRWT